MGNFSRSRTRHYVLIAHAICDFFSREVAGCRAVPERGGILIGSYRGPHLEIAALTVPGPTDVLSLTSFIKRDPLHQTAATAAWRKSVGRRTYVGEWHTHPFGDVAPSRTDRSTWTRITKRNKARCVFVLVSPADWGVFLVKSDDPNRIIPLAKIESGLKGIVLG